MKRRVTLKLRNKNRKSFKESRSITHMGFWSIRQKEFDYLLILGVKRFKEIKNTFQKQLRLYNFQIKSKGKARKALGQNN